MNLSLFKPLLSTLVFSVLFLIATPSYAIVNSPTSAQKVENIVTHKKKKVKKKKKKIGFFKALKIIRKIKKAKRNFPFLSPEVTKLLGAGLFFCIIGGIGVAGSTGTILGIAQIILGLGILFFLIAVLVFFINRRVRTSSRKEDHEEHEVPSHKRSVLSRVFRWLFHFISVDIF